ncbi:Lactosylceramide 4-alpha-galactosyltransferase, partial [Cladochytrium tenue]
MTPGDLEVATGWRSGNHRPGRLRGAVAVARCLPPPLRRLLALPSRRPLRLLVVAVAFATLAYTLLAVLLPRALHARALRAATTRADRRLCRAADDRAARTAVLLGPGPLDLPTLNDNPDMDAVRRAYLASGSDPNFGRSWLWPYYAGPVTDSPTGLPPPTDSAATADAVILTPGQRLDPAAQPPPFPAPVPSTPPGQNRTEAPATAGGGGVPRLIHFTHFLGNMTTPAAVAATHRGTARFLCAVESALRHNPAHRVLVHAEDQYRIVDSRGAFLWYWTLPTRLRARLRILPIDRAELGRDNPLEPWFAGRAFDGAEQPWQDFSHAARLALLWHFGGAYLDFDIVSVNSVDGLGRAVARHPRPSGFSDAVLSFPPHDPFVKELMIRYLENYDGRRDPEDPLTLARTFKDLCVARREEHADLCHDLGTAAPDRFFPVLLQDRDRLLQPYYQDCAALDRMSR